MFFDMILIFDDVAIDKIMATQRDKRIASHPPLGMPPKRSEWQVNGEDYNSGILQAADWWRMAISMRMQENAIENGIL